MLASSWHGTAKVHTQLDVLVGAATAVAAVSPWVILLTIFAMCVVYDQSMLLALQRKPRLATDLRHNSQLHDEQRLNCWTIMEDALHWPLLAVHEPQVRRVLR